MKIKRKSIIFIKIFTIFDQFSRKITENHENFAWKLPKYQLYKIIVKFFNKNKQKNNKNIITEKLAEISKFCIEFLHTASLKVQAAEEALADLKK